MAQSRKKQIESMLEQQKKLDGNSAYTKIVKYTLCEPTTIKNAIEIFTTPDIKYSAHVKINGEMMYFNNISAKNIETFEKCGFTTTVKQKEGRQRVTEVEGIPVNVTPGAYCDYSGGVIVEIAYRGMDEEDAIDARNLIEPKFLDILHKAGIPRDRVCVSESFMCENIFAKNKKSAFSACGYATRDKVDGCSV